MCLILGSLVFSCETLTTFHQHLKSDLFRSVCHSLATHLSAFDSFTTMALYKSIYLLTYCIQVSQRTCLSLNFVIGMKFWYQRIHGRQDQLSTKNRLDRLLDILFFKIGVCLLK